MVYEEYHPGFKRRWFNDGTSEDIWTDYPGSRVVDAREMSDRHNRQNKILADMIDEANALETSSNKLVYSSGSSSPVPQGEAEDLRNSIQNIKRKIKRFQNPK